MFDIYGKICASLRQPFSAGFSIGSIYESSQAQIFSNTEEDQGENLTHYIN